MTKQIPCRFYGVGLIAALALCIIALNAWLPSPVSADSAKEIEVRVDEGLAQFEKEVKGGKSFLDSSKGVLVFPGVLKGGFGVGAEYGEGALRIGGKTVDYYNTAAASFGLQMGGQVKTIIIVFLDENALKQFRDSNGWKAGVDGSIALVTLGAGGALDTSTIKDPIVGFIIGQKGLMYNLTLEGSKFTKLNKT